MFRSSGKIVSSLNRRANGDLPRVFERQKISEFSFEDTLIRRRNCRRNVGTAAAHDYREAAGDA